MKAFAAACLAVATYAATAPQEISLSEEEQRRMEQASIDYIQQQAALDYMRKLVATGVSCNGDTCLIKSSETNGTQTVSRDEL